MIWMIVLGVLGLLWLADAIKLRRRLAAIPVLPRLTNGAAAPVEGEDSELLLAVAAGVGCDPATRRAAAAHLRREGLEVLDLIPEDAPTWRLLLFLGTVDPAQLRGDPVALGRGAGHAVLVSRALLGRLPQGMATPPTSAAGLVRWTQDLKPYAASGIGFAVAPGLRAARETAAGERSVAELLFGGVTTLVFTIGAILVALGLAGPALTWGAPVPTGIAALALLHLQPLLITLGSGVHPRDRALHVLLRAPLELYRFVRLALSREATTDTPERRAAYDALAAGGPARWFEPRREDCPVCGGRDLRRVLRTPDLIQHKPGSFTIERCAACGHHFQNPRLSIAGLAYYYRDFYDGLGEKDLEAIFAASPESYRDRARAVLQVARPRRWLDVGTGHGHFCRAARQLAPEVRFDGLDFGESIEEAQRRGWIERAYRGLFPEVAAEFADAPYDVVSMSHYLEHTRDPRAEIAAAHAVLAEGGHLFIEVPDPASRLRHLLGRYWIPWFQPQHQHYLSVENLERLLREGGFTPVSWQRGEAHIPVDFRFGVLLVLQRLSPPERPWRRQARWRRWARRPVYLLGLPWLTLALLLDVGLAPVFRRAGWSNAYRVIARREPLPLQTGADLR